MSKPELYISIDIETDGPAHGVNSMLALGAAAFEANEEMADTWYCTLHPLSDAIQNPETMDWWKTQPEAWAEVNRGRVLADEAMASFVYWCDKLAREMDCKLIAVGWPIAFDFAFTNYYCHRFTGRNPLGFAGLDIRSYAAGLLGHEGYYDLPEELVHDIAGDVGTSGLRPHVAVDDAIGQGRLFMGLRGFASSLARPGCLGHVSISGRASSARGG